MWNALFWFGVGWWVGTNKALGMPIVPANVANASTAQDAATAAAEDVGAAVQAQASGGDAGGGFLVAGGTSPSAGPGPSVSNTGYMVNGSPVCVDSFMNLVDCTTGAPLDDSSAQIIINSLQPVAAQGQPLSDFAGAMYARSRGFRR